jgi:iron complex outermembrane receptor protein
MTMKQNFTRTLALAAVSATALMAAAQAASAQPSASVSEARLRFDIPAQPLGQALITYSRQAHVAIAAPAALVAGKQSRQTSGEMSPQQALSVLLEGTGLASARTAGGGLTLVAEQSTGPQSVEAASQDEAEPLEEIVVTAQGREQRLLEVPSAVTAMGSKELEARRSTSLNDLQYAVPGLSQYASSPGQELIQMRGMSSNLGLSTVGVYFNEFSTTNEKVQSGGIGSNTDIRMLDMARLEVLRGPQGTRYGAGSMGGTIRYIPAKPDLTAFGGSVEAEIGTVADGDESYRANVVLNAPLVEDKLGLRLVAGYQRDGGWIDNTYTGQEDTNEAEYRTFRASVLARPSENLELSLLYVREDNKQPNQNYGTDRKSSSTIQSYLKDRYDLVNGVVSYDLGFATLLDSIGYLDRAVVNQQDLTASFKPALDAIFGLPPEAITGVPFNQPADQRIFSNELRLTSNGKNRFNWTVGVYYRYGYANGDYLATSQPTPMPFDILRIQQELTGRSYAIFGEADYQLTDRLNILVGGRYFHDKQKTVSGSVVFGGAGTFSGEASFETFNPRVALRYDVSSDTMVYANVAKGFRSGGFNVATTPDVSDAYQPDEVWSYEVGGKSWLFDRRMSLEAAVYYSDWSDVQSNIVVNNIAAILNGGTVQGWGFEAAATATPFTGLTLSATYSWNNLEYKNSVADHYTGDPVDFARPVTYSASLDYRRPIFDETVGYFRADYQHADEGQYTLRNYLPAPIKIAALDLINLRAGLQFGAFDVSLYVQNLTDEDSPLLPANGVTAFENTEQAPRTIGLNVKARF